MRIYVIKVIGDKFKMKYLLILLVVTLIGCSKQEVKQTSQETKTSETNVTETSNSGTDKANIETVKIDLPSVQCSMCKKTIETAIKKDAGVVAANVDYKNKNCTVEFDKTKTGKENIEGMIIAAGYQANEKPADEKAYSELHGCCKLPKDQK